MTEAEAEAEGAVVVAIPEIDLACPDLHKSHLQTLNETGENSRKTDHNELSMYSNSGGEGYPRIQICRRRGRNDNE
jgi:hypothetical protein